MSNTPRQLLVQKFGGTSLADLRGFDASASVIGGYTDEYRVIVVLSAVKGVTDLLLAAIDTSMEGEDGTVHLAEAIRRERAILEALAAEGIAAPRAGKYLSEQDEVLSRMVEGIRLLGQCPEETRARILATGEGFSSRLMVDLLEGRGYRAEWSDTDILPPANDDWLDTLIDIDAAVPRVRERLAGDSQVVVLPGFYGRNSNGDIQLLGRNGTDYSAAVMAAASGAGLCQIWKEVDGFFTADPRIVKNARCLEEVSYEEAMELTYYGANVISAKALMPLAAKGIPCQVRNTYAPELPGTLVHGEAKRAETVRGISHLHGVSTVTLQGGFLRGRVGVAQRVMGTLAGVSVSTLLIVHSSSEYSLTLCVRQVDEKKALRALREEFHFELLHDLLEDINVLSDRAVISLVGEGMKHARGIAARFLTAISTAGVNVEVIAQGSTEFSISVVVMGEDAQAAARSCHTAFFGRSTHFDVVLLGCGNVGGELLAQFQRQEEALASHHMDLRVRAIASSDRLLLADDTIGLAHWREALEREGRPYGLDDIVAIRKRLGLLSPTLIDCTTDGEVASQYVRFLDAGYNIVAANKKANTRDYEYYLAMRDAEKRNFRKFLYETNVAAGLPFIDTLQSLIRSGDELNTFEGILSGSLSMIFGLLEDGVPLSQAVARAMELGYTEPDPRDDLSGMDVARKLLIIAREVGLRLELDDIAVEPVVPMDAVGQVAQEGLIEALRGHDAEFGQRIAAAAGERKVLRYVARIEDGACRVSIEAVAQDGPLGAIRDGENALVIHSRYYQPIPMVLRGYGAGAAVTAAGVFGDLLKTVWRPLDN
ncbi:MAG: bifunctional aspartate kinase/homoserine dehydrogenase I [Xanthomonadales bacterium]|nr:bifunctional aspartate kinase/homoserine dehydrogenase I [Gammaproteobacteria bacterium]MBT8051703.1 bifunctional aspartate kinase/homoserine dehydrogenase I [Gammaproteobacteria bacterium]MBT8057936.1 bifunctional aspartate kinase/homoserine dehydrogenase I [Gammaproteobacteria bacterium]NNJ78493.1 bifunctional aspartate kinase/homoserine dehydrogenase I [Xanthomonadales bacterium]NNL05747.1 bifunctional aspartate kinase/homoserine dehydrogenase I [Xanthomonadales bacterium]